MGWTAALVMLAAAAAPPAQMPVARGTRRAGDGTIEAWTLISPYPDPGLQRLEAGTLLLILTRP